MPDIRQGGGARQEPSGEETRDSAPPPRSSGPDPLIGRTISGRFRVIALVARGGMGKVYKAEQAPLGRICALKVLNPNYEGDNDPEFHKRFFLEASTAAKLTHPNTVTIFDYGKDEDIYFIAMEYIEGKTLHRVLRETGPMPEARAAHIARQICRSLREAHRLGVVHRDLKPANVLLVDHADEKDNVKVLDFGLVKDVSGNSGTEDLTQQGLFMGSPKYMSPEQITGAGVTEGSDIYSLGVILYEMLSGKVPFDRGKSVVTLMAHVNELPPPMTHYHPGLSVSAAMETIVSRCLQKDPAARFATMNDVLDALKRCGGGEWMTDTNEALPAVSYTGDALPKVQAPSMTPSGRLEPGSGPVSSGIAPRPIFVSPSVTDSLNPSPRLTDSVPPVRARGRGVVLVVLALAAAGLAALAFMTARPPGQAGLEAALSAVPTAPPSVATAGRDARPAGETSASASVTTAPATRTVRVESEPSGASVSEEGQEKCAATPCTVTWSGDAAGAAHKLSLSKAGFAAETIQVAPGDEKVSAKLDASASGPSTGPRTRPAGPSGPVAPPPKSTKPDDYKPSPY